MTIIWDKAALHLSSTLRKNVTINNNILNRKDTQTFMHHLECDKANSRNRTAGSVDGIAKECRETVLAKLLIDAIIPSYITMSIHVHDVN